ncbi:MAG: DUF2231 domain-containing protein [Aliihoeflea sp.]|jgi:uncharacterized membrane protein|uniref:DUF2231 domain-containing protein n=1 Tax=unclassified Aliihoeflea TaxID=2628764 RepID=UPI00046580AC|nr:DUF2231 domain-containing protein [Aliihoeflea sp. 2WW]
MNETRDRGNPVIEEVVEEEITSTVAIAGHPIHAMSVHFPIALVFGVLGCDVFYWWTGDPFWVRVGIWAAGFAFFTGIAAGIVGTLELLLVAGIRMRVASWTHAVAAMTLIAIAGTNWGLRLVDEGAILPHGILLSALAAFFTGLAGWHGGKLVFDHGVGLIVTARE